MEKKKHGLTDMQKGEYILNESGTFITTDKVEGTDTPENPNAEKKDEPVEEEEKKSSAGPEEKDITD